jgi:hypothetical protein
MGYQNPGGNMGGQMGGYGQGGMQNFGGNPMMGGGNNFGGFNRGGMMGGNMRGGMNNRGGRGGMGMMNNMGGGMPMGGNMMMGGGMMGGGMNMPMMNGMGASTLSPTSGARFANDRTGGAGFGGQPQFNPGFFPNQQQQQGGHENFSPHGAKRPRQE